MRFPAVCALLSTSLMNDQPSTDEPADDAKPFQIEVAERIKRLPGYLFAASTSSRIKNAGPATT